MNPLKLWWLQTYTMLVGACERAQQKGSCLKRLISKVRLDVVGHDFDELGHPAFAEHLLCVVFIELRKKRVEFSERFFESLLAHFYKL